MMSIKRNTICVALFAAITSLAASSAWPTGPAFLVQDINPYPDPEISSRVTGLVPLGASVYFLTSNYGERAALWKTDGTAQGTMAIKMFEVWQDGEARDLKVAGRNLFFIAAYEIPWQQGGPTGASELWRSDGTVAGTELLFRVEDGSVFRPTVVGNRLFFFSAGYMDHDEVLWVTDGTPAGTSRVADFGDVGSTAAVGNTLLFFVEEGYASFRLWRSNGSPAGTAPVSDQIFSSVESVVGTGDAIFFSASDGIHGSELWRSDGTRAGTRMVKDIFAGPSSSESSALVAAGRRVLFVANDGAHGFEVWVSDGTAAGTGMVKDITEGAEGTFDLRFFELHFPAAGHDGDLFFATSTWTGPKTLVTTVWRSDGSDAGTIPVTEITAQGRGRVTSFASAGESLFFATEAFDPVRVGYIAEALWVTDGTGGRLIREFPPHTGDPEISLLGASHGVLYFTADDGIHGTELWTSDGTEEGTSLLGDLHTGPASSGPSALTDVSGTIVFAASHLFTGRELWTSDGTPQGTALVKDINPGAESGFWGRSGGNCSGIARIGSMLYFSATEPSTGCELWRTDGTERGTVLVKDIFPGPTGSSPYLFVVVGETLFFVAADDHSVAFPQNQKLWKSDGTTAGTVALTSFGLFLRNPGSLTSFDGGLFFSTDDRLWRTDGAVAGTSWVWNGEVRELTVRDGRLFFTSSRSSPSHLWTSDGTREGTVEIQHSVLSVRDIPLAKMTSVAGSVYFVTVSGGVGRDLLWRLDETETAATVVQTLAPSAMSGLDQLTELNGDLLFTAIHSTSSGQNLGRELWKVGDDGRGRVLRDIRPGPDSSDPRMITTVGDILLFSADDGATGRELWATDGTPEGTRLIGDLATGAASSDPSLLMNSGRYALLSIHDPINGRELWKSDGSTPGTRLLQDISAGEKSSNPDSFTKAGRYVFFSAEDAQVGRELWAITAVALDERCIGDCDGSGVITVNELIRGVSIALGTSAIDECASFDADQNGTISIDELITAVNQALNGCR